MLTFRSTGVSSSRMMMVWSDDSSAGVSTRNTMVSSPSASRSSTMPILKERCATQAVPAALGENAEAGTVASSAYDAKTWPGGSV